MSIRIDGTNTTANPGITGGDADTGLQFGTKEVTVVTDDTDVSVNLSVNPGVAFGGSATPDLKIKNDAGALTITRAFDDNGTPTSLDLYTASNQAHTFRGNEFKFLEATNPTNEAEGNYISLNPRTDGSDADLAIFKYVKPNEYNGKPVYNFDDQGRIWARSSIYLGQQRTDELTPDNFYVDTTTTLSLSRGADSDTTQRQMRHLWQTVQSTDTGDIATYEYWNSLDGTTISTANDANTDLRFTMKLNGMTQSKSTIMAGRVENDAATPVSAYAGSSHIYSYGDSGGGVTYIRGDNNPSSSHFAFFCDNDVTGGSGDSAYTGIKFKVRSIDGRIYQDYGSTFSNADYAEYFEWHDGNPNDEYRAGHSVILVDGTDKIRIATTDDNPDDIIGIVSVSPGVVGDAYDLHWQGTYQKDQFGKPEYAPVQVYKWNPLQSDTQPTNEYEAKQAHEGCRVEDLERYIADGTYRPWVRDVAYEITDYVRVVNEDWDPTVQYTPREERPEWIAVGLVGKLWLKPNEPAGTRWKLLKTDADTGNKLWLVR
jgi:hypothetical protein